METEILTPPDVGTLAPTLEGYTGAMRAELDKPLREWKRSKGQLVGAADATLRPRFAQWNREHRETLERWREALGRPELGRVRTIADHLRQARVAVNEALTALSDGPAALGQAARDVESCDAKRLASNFPPLGKVEAYLVAAESHAHIFPQRLEAATWHMAQITEKLREHPPEVQPVATMTAPVRPPVRPRKARTSINHGD